MLFVVIASAVQVLVSKLPKVFEKYHQINEVIPYYDGIESDDNLIVIDGLVKDANHLVHNSAHQNMVIFTSENKVIKQFVTELGIEYVSPTSMKINHDNYHSSSSTILGNKTPSFDYKGPLLHGTNNILSFPLITGYVEDIKDQYVGSQLELIRLVQTRINTRIAVLPKELLDIPEAAPVISKVLDWTFKLINVLKIKVEHFKVDDSGNKISNQLKEYKIKDKIQINAELSNLDKPFKIDDLQVELIMLDPYIRTTFEYKESTSSTAKYSKILTLPDRYGYFTLRVSYKRYGFTYAEHKELIVIRHLAHDEYERFIPKAGPYYSTYFGLTASLVVVCFFWLFKLPENATKKNQ